MLKQFFVILVFVIFSSSHAVLSQLNNEEIAHATILEDFAEIDKKLKELNLNFVKLKKLSS